MRGRKWEYPQNMAEAKIHSRETMGALDGPGIRYVLFMKGCPLRCAFCQNPDTWASEGGETLSARDAAADILKYREFFDASGGGFTASGGEPLLQPEFLAELFSILKGAGVHRAIDTCGYVELSESVKKAARLASLVLLDIKHLDGAEHEKLTGKPNARVLEFLEFLSREDIDTHIRAVLINGVSSGEEYISRLANFLKKYSNVKRVDLLPYHDLGAKKWEALGLKYRLGDSAFVPRRDALRALEILQNAGLDATLQ